MNEQNIKLTKLASCAGCGAKVGAGVLAQLLDGLQVHRDENLLVGFDKSDDSYVYKVSETLTLARLRDLLHTSRKYSQAIIEYFDKVRITRKDGDVHYLLQGF